MASLYLFQRCKHDRVEREEEEEEEACGSMFLMSELVERNFDTRRFQKHTPRAQCVELESPDSPELKALPSQLENVASANFVCRYVKVNSLSNWERSGVSERS